MPDTIETAEPSVLPDLSDTPHGLADDLRRLEEAANGMPITVGRLLETLADRGHAVALILLAAPFVIVPIPGLSTIMGVVLLFLAVAVMRNRPAWLPAFIRRRHLSAEALHRLTGGTRRVLTKVEKLVKPRMEWLTGPRWHWLIGLSLAAATIALSLPIPIPGNNIPPAIGILLLAFGLLERDGLLVLIGHIYTLVLWVALLTLAIVFWEAIDEYVHALIDRVLRRKSAEPSL